MKPLLTVILPVYNARRFLREAVVSVLEEALPSLEVLVLDDGSTDGSSDTVKDLDVRVIRLEKNAGQASAQNVGISNARGEYIGFLDADDKLSLHGLRWRLEWLLQHPYEVVVAGRIAGVIDEAGKFLGNYQQVLNPSYRTPPSVISWQYLASGGEFPSQMWNLLFRKDFLLKVGPFDEKLSCAHDNDYFYRILRFTYIPFVDKPTVYYRLHGENLSGMITAKGFQYHRRALAENLLVHLSHGISPRS